MDELRKWKLIAERLFSIIDEIDTASDRFKPRTKAPRTLQNYYDYVSDIQRERFQHAKLCPACHNKASEAFCKTCEGIGIVPKD